MAIKFHKNMSADEEDDDPLRPEERKIMTFMLRHLNMSPREVAKYFDISVEHVCSILQRDLQWVMRG